MIIKVWKTLELKMIMILLMIMVSISSGVYYVMFRQYYNLTIDTLKANAVNAHIYAEDVIDKSSFTDLLTAGDENSRLYIETHRRLEEIRRVANISLIYTAKRSYSGEFIYLVNGLDRDSERFRHVGDLIEDEIKPSLEKCLNDETVLGRKILNTEWGHVYIAYFPFHDSEGRVIGAIGMEFDCDDLNAAINRAILITVLLTVILACLFSLVAFLTMKRSVRKAEDIYSDMEESLQEAHERSSLMLDTSPICAQIWDRNLNTIDCNEAGVRLYEFKDKAEYTKRFLSECSPEYQPDGQRSDEKAVGLVDKAFGEGICVFEWMHRIPGRNILFPAEVTLVRAKYKDMDVVIGYTRDLREQYKAMEERDRSLSAMTSILNGIDTMIYATVPDTCEILFINDHMKKHYGLEGDVIGQLCYKVLLEGVNERCENCPCDKLDLDPEGVVEWEEHSSLTGRIYKNTDRYINWHDGSRVHIQHSIDITETVRMQEHLKARDIMLQAVNDASALLQNSDLDRFESALDQSMGMIAEAAKIDVIYLWKNEVIDGRLYCFQLFEWSPQKTMFADGKPYSYDDIVPGWEETLSGGGYINNIVRNMPQKDRDHLSPSGILSILVVPIYIKDQFWGFVGFDDCQKERIFSSEEESILHSASLIIANSFFRNEMIKDLRDSSEHLRKQDELLYAVNRAAVMLLSTKESEDIEPPLLKSMELVGHSINADRVHLWRNAVVDDELVFVHAYEWLSDLGKTKASVPMSFMTPYEKIHDWISRFMRSEIVGGPLSELSREERAYFSLFDLKTVILIPLFLDEEFWGLVSIDDCERERNFSEGEIDILRSVSLMMASAINRHSLVERRTQELALQTATLTTLLDSIPDLFYAKDLDLRFMHVNNAMAENYGLRKEDIIGKKEYDIWPPGTFEEDYDFWNRKVISEKTELKNEVEIMNSSGVNKYYESIRQPIWVDGQVSGVFGIARDITVRKEMDMARSVDLSHIRMQGEALARITVSPAISSGDLKAAADLISAEGCSVLRASRVSVWLLSEDGNALECISGYSAASGGYINAENYDLSGRQTYADLLRSERLLVMNSREECRIILSTDEEGDYENLCAALEAPIRVDGKLAGVVSVEQHISDKYQDSRRWRTGERGFTSSLADLIVLTFSAAERRKARDDAYEASQAKSKFLANMSHEIRTPMNVILGVTEIILQGEGIPDHISEGLDKIYNSCDMLLGIINDILDFSKIEAGKLDIHPIQYEVASLINDSVQLNMMRISDKPIEFGLEIGDCIPAKLIGDELRIKQILNNLLSNAFKYTDSGSVTLYVSANPGPDERSVMLELSVRDTGYGMSKSQVDNLFEEYTRFHQHNARGIEGTGLGLAITHRLVSIMKGEIGIESEPGKGSFFTVRLPQQIVDGSIMSEAVTENLTQFRAMINRERRRIIRDPMPYGSVLVVDDVETNRYVASGLMNLYMLQIDTAASGFEAIGLAESGKVYDIIFMDHMMPEMDGMETVERLRGMGYTAPIVALTANTVAGQAEIFLQNGFDEFISKPIDIRQLNAVLNKLIRDKQPPEVVEVARQAKSLMNAPGAAFQSASQIIGRRIDGLDIAKGLARYEGNTDIYLKLLRYYTVNLNSMLETVGSFTEEDLDSYRITIHGIKGASYDIYADRIGEQAEALENAAKNSDLDYILKHNPLFHRTAGAFVAEISAMLSAIDAENPKPVKGEPDGHLLERLAAACAEYDMDEVSVTMEEIELFRYDSDGGLVEWLRENVDRMDFKQIIERLT